MQREYKISLSQEFYSDVVYLSQYDEDYPLIFTVFDKHAKANSINGCTAELTGLRPDGMGFTYTSTAVGHTVSFTIDAMLTGLAGAHTAEIIFYKDTTKRMGTANIRIVVEPAARPDGTIDGDVERCEEIAAEVQEIVDTAAATVKGEAEAWAVGQRDGVDVPSTDPAYENNAKYYAQQAAQTAEEISGVTDQVAQNTSDISDLKEDLNAVEAEIASIEPGLSDNAKVALLNCFAHVAWTDEHGQTYYDALESALYADSYPKITAVFDAGTNVIYTDTALNTLKQYLTVKYFATKDSTGTVIASTDYSLTGTLVEGSSTVSVSYDGLTTSFVINGVVDFYNIWEWSLADGDFTKLVASTDRNSNSLTGVTIRQDSGVQYRRNCSVTKGILPYTIRDTETLSQYYPIPVPATANKVTVSVTPDTQFTFLNIVKYDSATNKYNYYAGASNVNGWTQGVNEKSFTASDNLFLFFNVKYDSAGSSYPTEPSNITVEFEEV